MCFERATIVTHHSVLLPPPEFINWNMCIFITFGFFLFTAIERWAGRGRGRTRIPRGHGRGQAEQQAETDDHRQKEVQHGPEERYTFFSLMSLNWPRGERSRDCCWPLQLKARGSNCMTHFTTRRNLTPFKILGFQGVRIVFKISTCQFQLKMIFQASL